MRQTVRGVSGPARRPAGRRLFLLLEEWSRRGSGARSLAALLANPSPVEEGSGSQSFPGVAEVGILEELRSVGSRTR